MRSFTTLRCTSTPVTSHSAFLHLIELTCGASVVARCLLLARRRLTRLAENLMICVPVAVVAVLPFSFCLVFVVLCMRRCISTAALPSATHSPFTRRCYAVPVGKRRPLVASALNANSSCSPDVTSRGLNLLRHPRCPSPPTCAPPCSLPPLLRHGAQLLSIISLHRCGEGSRSSVRIAAHLCPVTSLRR